MIRRIRETAAVAAIGAALAAGGCSESTQTIVEDGIINASTSALASFYQALLLVATEDPNSVNP